MGTVIQQRVRALANRAARMVRWHGVGQFVTVAGCTVLVMGSLDYLVRYQDVGVQWIATLLVWAVLAASFYRFVYRAWRYRCTELQAARRIERRFPQLGDRVTTAVAFAGQAVDEPLAGSLALRRAVVTQADSLIGELDVDSCLDDRPLRRVGAAGLVVGAVLLALTLLDAGSVRLAVARMFAPWAAGAWPRRHVLRLVSPAARIAIGQDYEVVVADANGQLPPRVRVHWWSDGEDVELIELPVTDNVVQYRRSNVRQGFRLRVTGGDDDQMPWFEVEVVTPPRLVEQRLTLYPPAYLRASPRQASGSFQVLQGTQIVVQARVDRPLSQAFLQTDTGGTQQQIELQLDADRLGFSLPRDADTPWLAQRSGTYGFRLVDATGLDTGRGAVQEVRVVQDAAPTVNLVRPATDLNVLAGAVVPLQATVHDDLGIRVVQLAFVRGGESASPELRVLWSEPAPSTADARSAAGAETRDGVRTEVEHVWDLSQLPGLQAGQLLSFHVAATDLKDQQGVSATRRVLIITRDELLERLGQRQSETLSRIAEIVRRQQQVRAQVRALEIQLQETRDLGRDDVDQLQSAELNQRQVRQQLTRAGDGVLASLRDMLAQLEVNRVDNPEMSRRLRYLLESLQELDRSELARIPHHLLTALKAARRHLAQPAPAALAALRDSLPRAGAEQDVVIDRLEQLLRQFSQWDDYQRLTRQMAFLRRQQEDVAARTEQLRAATLTRSLQDLTPEQRADVRRLGERQSELARQFDKLMSRMGQTRRQLADSDPVVATTLADAIALARDSGTDALLHNAARQVADNQLGRAVEQQRVALKQLDELLDILANRREPRLDRQQEKLGELATQLDQLRQQQQDVAAAAAKATRQALPGLARREKQLAAQARQLARRIERVPAPGACAAVRRAGDTLDRAAEAAQRGQQEDLREQAEKGQQQLDDAARQLEQARQRVAEQLELEKRKQALQVVAYLIEEQSSVLAETREIESARTADALLPAQRDAIRDLDGRQQQLAEQTRQLAGTVPDWPAFQLALDEIVRRMAAAQQQLAVQQTGPSTQQPQTEALRQLEQLRDVLQGEPPPEPAGADRPPKAGKDQQQQEPSSGAVLAQLKLLRTMQQDILRETSRLDDELQTGDWTPELTRRRVELIERQGRLADVVQQLLSAPEEPGGEAPAVPEADPFEGLDPLLQDGGPATEPLLPETPR